MKNITYKEFIQNILDTRVVLVVVMNIMKNIILHQNVWVGQMKKIT